MHDHVFVGVTRQTVGRIGTGGDGVDDFLTRAVMTGRTGSGPVGDDIVQAPFNFCPGARCMTVAAELTRRIKGEIASALDNGVSMGTVERIKTGTMTGRTVAWGGLTVRDALQSAGGGVVTAGACGMRLGSCADQGVIVTTGTAGRANGDNPAVIPYR